MIINKIFVQIFLLIHRTVLLSYLIIILFLAIVFPSCNKVIIKNETTSSPIKFFTGSNTDKVSKIEITADGGFIYCGYTTLDSSNVDAFMMKVDSNGNQEWYKTYGGRNYDDFRDATQCADGGFVAVGSTNSFSIGAATGSRDLGDYMVRTDRNGTVLWYKSIGTNITLLQHVIEMPDKNIVTTGYYYDGDWNITLMKFMPDGGFIFHRKYPNVAIIPPFYLPKRYHEYATWVGVAQNGNLMVGGVMDKSYNVSDVQRHLTFFMTTDEANGNPKFLYIDTTNVRDWYFWNGVNPYRLSTVKALSFQDGFLLGTDLEFPGSMQLQLTQLDLNGNRQWERKYPGLGNSIFYDMATCPDGGVLMMGASTSGSINFSFQEGFRNLKGMLKKVDANGNEIWTQYNGSNQNASMIKAAKPLTFGGWAIAGNNCINEKGYDKMFWMSVDENGKIKSE